MHAAITPAQTTPVHPPIRFCTAHLTKKTINGELKFAVCKENECRPSVEKISIDVDVN